MYSPDFYHFYCRVFLILGRSEELVTYMTTRRQLMVEDSRVYFMAIQKTTSLGL